MTLQVEAITDSLEISEGPHWDDRQQALFFVAIHQSEIHKYVPTTKTHTRTKVDEKPGFIIPVEGTTDHFIIGLESKFVIVQWDGGDGTSAKIVKELGAVDQDVVPRTRINDGKADPMGRVFSGTGCAYDENGVFFPNLGSLFRVDSTGIHKLYSGISIPNGPAWDLERKVLYCTDTLEKKMRRYVYDVETGEISNLSYFFDFEENNIEGYPDGHTVDADGNLWIAVFNGSCVLKVDPVTGQLLQKVPMPVKQVTSVTFGGENLDLLFVTTGRVKNSFTDVQKPPAGSTYMISGLGVKGKKSNNFKLY